MDPRLVVRARRGEQPAFEALTVACHPRFYRLAYGILRDPVQAEEAVQQAFIDIWRHLRRLRDAGRFDAWSCRFVVDACRAEAARQPQASPADIEPVLAPAPSSGPFSAAVDREAIGRGFRRLTLDDRAVLVLRHLLRMPAEDVASAMGAPAGSGQARVDGAVAALGDALDAAVASGVDAPAVAGAAP
jgi:RNA polymerase sigma-70 factor (ECF subfamily)